MGCCCSTDSLTLIFLGLCDSGKSTIIGQIEYHSFRVTNPTIGKEESLSTYRDKQVEIWDISGREIDNWLDYSKDSDGIIFVIDARNRKELQTFVNCSNQVLNAEDSNHRPILFYINWASAEHAISEDELRSKLNIESRSNIDIYFQECNAKTGEGIIEGYNWLMSKIEELY